MRILATAILIICLAFPVMAEESASFKDEKSKLSYAIGLSIGADLLRQEAEIDVTQIASGLKASYLKEKPLMTQEEMVNVLVAYQQEMQGKQAAKAKVQAEENIALGVKFLEENAKKEGVISLPSGLQYKIVEKGEGESPTANDQVKVHYRGTLIDGKEFDSSYKRGEPVSFPVGGVIPGWTEALQLMKKGSKWQLVIPAGLAYGERGAPPVIGPNATLVFDVELLEVIKSN